MNAADIISWFSDDPIPNIVGDPVIVIGGTSLLREFFRAVCEGRSAGRLSIAVPFSEGGFAEMRVFWESMNHPAIDFRMLVRSDRDARVAWQHVCHFPWRSASVGVAKHLHAKVYVFERDDLGGVALIGSHNMTQAGNRFNQEAGVLITSHRLGTAASVVSHITSKVTSLLATSRIVVDTTVWPNVTHLSERTVS